MRPLDGPVWPELAVHHANLYGQAGIPVFPIRPGTKRPYRKGWMGYASTDPERIRRMWHHHPDASIGLRTGIQLANQFGRHLFVIDVDPRNGGWQSYLRLLRDAGVPHPRTAITVTGSGGLHVFLVAPSFAKSRPLDPDAYPGIDIKGYGGYVIAPPSLHSSGRAYRSFRHPLEVIAEASPGLLALIPMKEGLDGPRSRRRPAVEAPPSKPAARVPLAARTSSSRAGRPARAIRWPSPGRGAGPGEVEAVAAEMVVRYPVSGPGQRNEQLLRIVATLVGGDVPDEVIKAVCLAWYDRQAANIGSSRAEHGAEVDSMILRTRSNPQFEPTRGRAGSLSEAEHLDRVVAIPLSQTQLEAIRSGAFQEVARAATGQQAVRRPQEGRGGRRKAMSEREPPSSRGSSCTPPTPSGRGGSTRAGRSS